MSDLMAFSFKKEPKEIHEKTPTPIHLTVPTASYWKERDDPLWKKYVNDLKKYSYDLHNHNRRVEMMASNRTDMDWSNSNKVSNTYLKSDKSSMVEYLMSKMDHPPSSMSETVIHSANSDSDRKLLDLSLHLQNASHNNNQIAKQKKKDNISTIKLPKVIRYNNRPVSAPPLLRIIESQHFNQNGHHKCDSSDRTTSIDFNNSREGYHTHNIVHNQCGHLIELDETIYYYDFRDKEPPLSKVIRRSTLNLRSKLRLHDRWTDHLLEQFEMFAINNVSPDNLKSLEQYKSKEHSVTEYVLNCLVEHCVLYELKQRLILIRETFLNLRLEQKLFLTQHKEKILTARYQLFECISKYVNSFYDRRINSTITKTAFLLWRKCVRLKKMYVKSAKKYAVKHIKTQYHLRFLRLKYLTGDVQSSKRQMMRNDATGRDNKRLSEKLNQLNVKIKENQRKKKQENNSIMLLNGDKKFLGIDLEETRDAYDKYCKLLNESKETDKSFSCTAEMEIKKLEAKYKNVLRKKKEKLIALSLYQRKITNQNIVAQIKFEKKMMKRKKSKKSKSRKALPTLSLLKDKRQEITLRETSLIPSKLENNIWDTLKASTEFYVARNNSTLKAIAKSLFLDLNVGHMIGASSNNLNNKGMRDNSFMVLGDHFRIGYFKLQALFSKKITKYIMIKFCDESSAKKFSPLDIKLKYKNRNKFEISIESSKVIIKPFNEHIYSESTINYSNRFPYNFIAQVKVKKKIVIKPVIAMIFAVKDKYRHSIHDWLKSDSISCWLDDCKKALLENPKLTLANLPFKQQIADMGSSYLGEQLPSKKYFSSYEGGLEKEEEAKIEDDSALDENEDEGQEDEGYDDEGLEDSVNEDKYEDEYEDIEHNDEIEDIDCDDKSNAY
jgi:hypothetical protein